MTTQRTPYDEAALDSDNAGYRREGYLRAKAEDAALLAELLATTSDYAGHRAHTGRASECPVWPCPTRRRARAAIAAAKEGPA